MSPPLMRRVTIFDIGVIEYHCGCEISAEKANAIDC